MADRYGGHDALFPLKAFLAAMLAYYIALRIGLDRPYWAIITAYIVAQPLAGAVSSKAMFAAAGASIYDVTLSGTGVAAVTGLTNARFQFVNLTRIRQPHVNLTFVG